MAEAQLVAGIDLGGTKILSVCFSRDLTIAGQDLRSTDAELGPDAVIGRMVDSARAATGANTIVAAGISAPGPADLGRGIITPPPNLPGWHNVPLARSIGEQLGVPAWVENDANAAALAEHRLGAGRGFDHMILVTLGTGIGGGLILDGKLRTGWRASAGEVGHTVVAGDNGVIGKTGQPGTVEPLASRTGMEAQIAARVAQGQASVVPELMLSLGQGRLTSRVIYEALRRNDAVMREVLAISQRALGLLAGNLINILDPQMVIFGGGVTERLGSKFVAPIRRVAYANLLNKQNARLIRIVPAALKDASGVVGAAVLARQLLG